MNTQSNEINDKNELNSEKINLTHFFCLIASPEETKSYLRELNYYFMEFNAINYSRYNRLNELYYKLSSLKKNKNFIDLPIYQIELILRNIMEMQLKISYLTSSNCELFNLIQIKLDDFGKIILDISQDFKKSSFYKDISFSKINDLNKEMGDLEKKLIDEFIYEKYNKHVVGVVDEKVDDLISRIKKKETNLFDSIKEKKSKDYALLKESNDKIQSVYNDLNDIFCNYFLCLKNINTQFSNNLNNLKYVIDTNSTKDENNVNNNANVVCSKSDYELQEKDLVRAQYQINIIKNNKIYIQNHLNNNKIEKNDEDKNHNSDKINKIKTKDNNLQQGENYGSQYLLLTEKEIYEIISKLYSYDLNIIDKSKYNLEEQKGMLIAMDLSNKILSYSENNESTISKLKEDYKEILESINSKILNNIINIEKFFVALNNYRVNEKIEFSEKFFDLIIYIYNETNNLLIKNIDFKLEDLMVILSQTYYKINNGEKVYVLEFIKSHEIYKNLEFWKNIMIKKINDEFMSIKNYNPKFKLNQEKKDEIIMPKIISFFNLMNEFDISKDKIIETLNQVFDMYKCTEATRKEIFSVIT